MRYTTRTKIVLLRKVVIPAGGLGTRLLPATKEQPKEMLPLFARGNNGRGCLKPVLQLVFEELYDVGFREFCFVIGKGKRAIEDHFTPDLDYLGLLEGQGKVDLASELEAFYARLRDSVLVWINQPEPKGFGDAVAQARPFVEDEDFMVHAGDTYILSPGGAHFKRLMEAHSRLGAEAVFTVQRVDDPRDYGVVEACERNDGVHRVSKIVEKPEAPRSDMAIMPIYVFKRTIFDAISKAGPGLGDEVWLTDAIQLLADQGRPVYGVEMGPDEVRLDVGNPDTYWKALQSSYECMKN